MAPYTKMEMLSTSDYDKDVASYHSASDRDSDSEDDVFGGQSATSHEPNENDRAVLLQEEEQERLISNSKAGPLDKRIQRLKSRLEESLSAKISKRDIRRQNGKSGRRKGCGKDEDSEMMHEMEEGAKTLSSSSSTTSFDLYRKEWAMDEKQSQKSVRRRFVFVYVFIALVFVLLAFGSYQASTSYRRSHGGTTATLSNGTHLFAPTTILISLDGFRADFLNRDLTPALNAFIASGVSPRYMLPSFPSVTFPNHFTLVTGLYPESHGIVGNTFWDPILEEEFYYTDPSRSMQPKWWTAEPLWVTAENQGVRTAIHMWPGSEAHIPDIDPTYVDKFNATEDLSYKVERVLGWLDLPGDHDDAYYPSAGKRRPQLIAAYVPNVDAMGHLAGPNSTEIRATIADVDSMLTLLTEGLLARNLTEIVNMVIVSDHGMATTSTSRLIQLDDIIDLSLVDHIDGWPLRGLRLKNPERDLPTMYEQLLAESKKSEGFDVYTLETMPDRYHFTNNNRIAPLWIVPKTGWGVVERTDFDVAEAQTIGKAFHPMGMHGYDHEHPLMRAIFVARGPAFPHEPNSRVPVFQNIEVYNILCDSLGIKPHPNNGTLRLPLQPIGLHSDENAPVLDTPLDPGPAGAGGNSTTTPGHTDFDHDNSAVDHPTGEADVEEAADGDVTGETGETENDIDEEDGKKSWWDFVHQQLEEAKEWAKGIIDAITGNKHGDDESKDG